MTSKFAIVPADAIFDQRIKPQHLQTLAALSYYGGHRQRGCWPAYSKLSEELKTSRRSIMEHVKHLIDCGYVTKETRLRENGSRTSNVYRVELGIEMDELGSEEFRTTPSVDTSHHPSENPRTTPSEEFRTPIKNYTNLELDKKNKYKRSAMQCTILEWEVANGRLVELMVHSWVKVKGFCPTLVAELIEEFRTEMQGKGLRYADFRAAFQTYLNKGYLSRKPAQCMLATSPHRSSDGTTINRRGGAL